MAMLSAMFSGVSGLSSNGTALSSVADNIANINTTAYKSTRANFGDIMVSSLTVGGSLSSQVGTGARIMNIQYMLTQGSFETTDIATDLAINGAGYFQVSDPRTSTGSGTTSGTSTASSGTIYMTRAGEFLLDDEGYIVNPQGYRLQGFNVNSSGELEQIAEDLRLVTQQTDAVPTDTVDMSINLNAEDTSTHHPSQAIDPDSDTTWNYMNTTRVYDSLGIGHDLALFYQQLSTYEGTTPSGTSTSWKVSVFENDDGTYSANPTFPDNTFYMHFDTDGHLVGTSTGQPAYGDMYTSSGTVTSGTSNVSDRMGESLTYTGDGNQQVVRTTASVTFSAATGGTETVTIGSDTITMGATGSATAAATYLAEQINSDSGYGFYATVSGATVTLHSKGSGGPYDVSTSGTTLTSDDSTTLNGLISLIDNSRAATGTINLTAAAAADTVTFNGTVYTMTGVYGGLGSHTFTNATELAAEINNDFAGVAAVDGNNVDITWSTAGTAGNAIAMSTSASTRVILSSSTLLNGLDDSSTTLVDSSAVASGSSYALRLARTDTGSSATITLASTNTMGDNLGLDFDSWTQDQYASDAQSVSTVETSGERTLTYDFPGATADQEIEFDFTPAAGADSTQSAGDNETFYLHQNGSPRGTLQSISIDDTGLISGQFSNGSLHTLGAVSMTNVANPNALEREGDNLWSWTLAAGDPLPATRPGSGGLGLLESGALEQSNVDLADQFVKMINYQRGFQANSRTISTTDEMLAELINLKR